MQVELISAIAGGTSGALVSGIILWIFEKRKDNINSKKYKQIYKDIFLFLKQFPEFSNDTDLLENYFKSIGTYRSKNISPILEKANLLKINILGNGGLSVSIKSLFRNFSTEDIKLLKKEIKDGKFDELLL